MVVMAAAAFHGLPGSWDIGIETAYRTLIPLFGAAAAAIFMISLIASGVSSSVVGIMASQVIMQGFVGFRIPVWVRRLLTMVPAFMLAACHVSVTTTLVLSQVVLSMVLPLPMITLLIFTGREDVSGSFANSYIVRLVAAAGAILVIVLNLFLLLQIAGIDPLTMFYSI
jgi:manganese transport protein